MKENFDPLINRTGASDEHIILAAKKREIKNILKSYVGTFDSFSELIQNAMDSVDKRALLEGSTFIKKIAIDINLEKNTFSIVDNGVGFDEAELELFLAPNISFKDGNNTRGNKGVGATYIAYGFNSLVIGTKKENFSFLGEIVNGRKWAEDNSSIVVRPIVKSIQDEDLILNNMESGAFFKIKYGGDYTRPKNLSYFMATTAQQWKYLLLLKTPLGSIDFFGNNTPIYFDLKVTDTTGKITMENNLKTSYIYPHENIIPSADFKKISDVQKDLINAGKDPSALPSKFKSLLGIYEYFTSEELKNLISGRGTKKEENSELIDKYSMTAYGFFGYSTSLWDEFNDKVAGLRKGYRVMRGGLLIANNNMIQGEYITIPLTSNIGYQNQAHIIVHLINADPDLGRKGFQPELKDLSENVAVSIINKLKRWKKLLRNDTGAKYDLGKQTDLFNWISSQEMYEKEHPLRIINENFFNPVNEISISSIPQSEQDVIVLFNQLIAGGVIRGIKLLATSQSQTYDGIFKFFVKEPEENHIFNKEKNPLGIYEFGLKVGNITRPLVLEYKYNLDALFQEFENEEKFERDINLAITWELGSNWKKSYEVTSLLDLDNIHLRRFHGITHIIRSQSGAEFYLIVLKELVDYLENVDSVQSYQKVTYGNL